MKTTRSTEKGQILVLLALALLGLLGFTALAIDGGMIYADRRYMQSSADAASLAGGGFIASEIQNTAAYQMHRSDFNCGTLTPILMGSGSTGEGVALAKAAANGFDATAAGSTDVVDVVVSCDSGLKTVDVQVTITHETNTSFVHLFTGEAMKNTVTSVTTVEPGTLAGGGYSIVALREECDPSDPGVTITGNTDVLLIDGGIWSNSCMTYDGTSLKVKVEPPATDSIVYNTDLAFNGTDPADVIPAPVDIGRLHDATNMNVDITCPSTAGDPHENYGQHSDTTPMVLSPGNIGDITMTKGTIVLSGGLYCIDGTVNLTGGEFTIDTSDPSSPKGVTLYFTGNSFSINGGVHVVLASPNEEPTFAVAQVGDAIEDLLMYVPRGFSPVISLNGNSGSSISGTIFAPESFIDVGGNTTLDSGETFTLTTSIIGLDVKVHGTPGINIVYDPTTDYGEPTSLYLRK